MPDKAFDALKHACRQQIGWLQAHADCLEFGNAQLLEDEAGAKLDRSGEVAEEFRHQANNLHAVMDAYERLASKASEISETP